MPSLAFIEKQLERERQRAKVEPDLAALIKQAIADALAEAGVTAAPQPKAPSSPPLSPRIARMLRPARDYTPLPPSPPAPRPSPLPVRPDIDYFKRVQIQRDHLGRVQSLHSPGRPVVSVTRDSLGYMDVLSIDGKPVARFQRGADGTVVGTVPIGHPLVRYDGKAVPPAPLNAKE